MGHQGQASRHARLPTPGRQVPKDSRPVCPPSGRDSEEVEDNVHRYMEQRYRHVRAQVPVPGHFTYGARAAAGASSRPRPTTA